MPLSRERNEIKEKLAEIEQIRVEMKKLLAEMKETLQQAASILEVQISDALHVFLEQKMPNLSPEDRRRAFSKSIELKREFCEFLEKRGIILRVDDKGNLVFKGRKSIIL